MLITLPAACGPAIQSGAFPLQRTQRPAQRPADQSETTIFMALSRYQARLPVAIVILSIAVVGFATGLTIPLVALRMYDQQYDPFMTGMMAAAPALGIIVAAPLVRRLVILLGRKRLLLTCFALSASSIMLLEHVSSLALTFPLRFAMGGAAGVIIALGESWINELTGDKTRGRVVALYATAFTVSQLTGPALVSLFVLLAAAPTACRPHLQSPPAFSLLRRFWNQRN
ncbi:MFS transporter [Massilia sp. CCM 8734]|uniref:MFS transporter n=1 Tax=Massilia sp. CCM 8734 TaxID=2609283 RepID=UPI0014211053|nr:MFS transporter [Massilia sp. CCM 8734]